MFYQLCFILCFDRDLSTKVRSFMCPCMECQYKILESLNICIVYLQKRMFNINVKIFIFYVLSIRCTSLKQYVYFSGSNIFKRFYSACYGSHILRIKASVSQEQEQACRAGIG